MLIFQNFQHFSCNASVRIISLDSAPGFQLFTYDSYVWNFNSRGNTNYGPMLILSAVYFRRRDSVCWRWRHRVGCGWAHFGCCLPLRLLVSCQQRGQTVHSPPPPAMITMLTIYGYAAPRPRAVTRSLPTPLYIDKATLCHEWNAEYNINLRLRGLYIHLFLHSNAL